MTPQDRGRHGGEDRTERKKPPAAGKAAVGAAAAARIVLTAYLVKRHGAKKVAELAAKTKQGKRTVGQLQKSASTFSTLISQFRTPEPSPGGGVQQAVKTVASATKRASAVESPPAYDFAALMKQSDELLKKMYADLLSQEVRKVEVSVGSRLKHAWNALLGNEFFKYSHSLDPSYSYRPDRPIFNRGNERSITTSVYSRITLDAASIGIQHVRLDDDGRFTKVIDSSLNSCLTLEADLDQTRRAFTQDVVMSMLDEGYVAIVPTDTDLSPEAGSFKIETMCTGKIVKWYPKHIKVRVYNKSQGEKQDIVLPKSGVTIIESPLFAVMNEPSSAMQQLIQRLSILDAVNEQSGSGKLNLIVRLPYAIKTEARRQQTEKRCKDIEEQLSDSKYDIAYTDGTEHVVQLNRPVDDDLISRIKCLTNMLYNQLGITQRVLDGAASDRTKLSYGNRTIEPILLATVDEMKRKFLTKTARSQEQPILLFRDPFRLVPINDIVKIADKVTHDEITTSNEVRQKIDMKPSKDPKADELRNSNLSAPKEESNQPPSTSEGGNVQNEPGV